MATFVLASHSRGVFQKMHCLMLSKGTHRVSLKKNGEYTAWANVNPAGDPLYWTNAFYAYHHAHDDPMKVCVYAFGGQKEATPELAVDRFAGGVIEIKGNLPIPVMFCITDTQDGDNRGGLTVEID
ncbi:MAG: hypothetical protein IT353_03400 [Gemmatimonadaceae bacterium]|nr:hypothetical protein [Gemmatimonadaceae bacterium]